MTEFQRAVVVVETLEALVSNLCAGSAPNGSRAAAGAWELPTAVDYSFFVFDPPSRQEVASTCDDWVVVGTMSAFESQVSDELRSQFAEATKLFEELTPVMERMRRRFCARAELEVVRAQLCESLPEAGGNGVAAAEDVGSSGSKEARILASLLTRAMELERIATYGSKMADQASELIARFDAAHALYNTDVVPRIAAAVVAAEADAAEQQQAVLHAEALRAEVEGRQAREKEQRLLAELLEASERGLEQARLQAEMEARRREAAAWCAVPRPRAAMAAPCARAFS